MGLVLQVSNELRNKNHNDGYPNVKNSYVKNNSLFVIEIDNGDIYYIPLAGIYSIKETRR